MSKTPTQVRKTLGHAPTAEDLASIAANAEAQKAPAAKAAPKKTAKKSAKKAKAKVVKKAKKAPAKKRPADAAVKPARVSNIDRLVEMLRDQPRTLDVICKKFDWQPHSARAAIVNAKAKLPKGETIERNEALAYAIVAG